MFCGNCGAENENGAKFCKNCGQPLAGSEPVKQEKTEAKKKAEAQLNAAGEAAGAAATAAKEQAGAIAEKAKALPKKMLAMIGGGIVILVILICVMMKSGSTINLDKYLVIEADGYDGYGDVNYRIDWDAIEEKYGKKIKFTSQAVEEYGNLLKGMDPMEVIENSVYLDLEQWNGVTNGDEVAYEWNIDEELETYVKCKLKYSSGVYTVAGLKEVGKFDAFADLEVTFSGVAPDGKANIVYTGSKLDLYDFSCDKTGHLKNGDTVTITLDDGVVKRCAEQYGMAPQETEKVYTVDAIDEYATKLADINDAGIEKMKAQASDVFYSYAAKNWSENVSILDFQHVGEYFLTNKNPEEYTLKNWLVMVFKPTVHMHYEYGDKVFDQDQEYFWYIGFDNLMVSPEGELTVDLTNYDTPNSDFTIDSGLSNGWFSTKAWQYDGCLDIDGIFKETVTSNLEHFNHEDRINETQIQKTPQVDPAETEAVEGEAAVSEGGYLLPDSGIVLITKDQLEGFTAEECKRARNEIYARHGRKFKDNALQSYFDSCDWYEGTIEPDRFSESMLSDVEIANRDLIVEYEKEHGFS